MMTLYRRSFEGTPVRVHLGASKEEIRQIVLITNYYCCYCCCYCSYCCCCYYLLHSRRIWEVLEMIVSTKQRARGRSTIFHSFHPICTLFTASLMALFQFFAFSQSHFSVAWLLLSTGACKTPEVSFRSWMCNKEWSSKLKNLIKSGPPVKNLAGTFPQN